jgi:hypothetical protein
MCKHQNWQNHSCRPFLSTYYVFNCSVNTYAVFFQYKNHKWDAIFWILFSLPFSAVSTFWNKEVFRQQVKGETRIKLFFMFVFCLFTSQLSHVTPNAKTSAIKTTETCWNKFNRIFKPWESEGSLWNGFLRPWEKLAPRREVGT